MEFSGQYLVYEEYRSLGGTLDLTPFNLLEYEARKKIDERTQGRLKKISDIPQEVKMCMFALINSLNNYLSESSSNRNIASESVGSYSVSYVTGNALHGIMNYKNDELNVIISSYLLGVIVNDEHILYLGVN